jgi:hypothetical protein
MDGYFHPPGVTPMGHSHDGLADLNHTLLGLDPGADARIDLPFLVI